MAFFSSEYECTVDAKGRMVLPSKVKNRLPENDNKEIVINRGVEPCLVIYPTTEWNKISAQVSGLNEFDEENRMVQRNFLRGSAEVELDNMGRFLIPKTMLKYAGIEKAAIVVGLGNRLEIWNPDTYEQYLIKDRTEFSKLLQKHLGSKPTE
jgi:MraZ protein